MKSKKDMVEEIRRHPGFSSMHWEDDGCFEYADGSPRPGLWIYLKEGWETDPELGSIHEPTLTDALRVLRRAEKTDWHLRKAAP